VALNRVVVRATGDQLDLMAGLVQSRADQTADCPGAEDYVPHRLTLLKRDPDAGRPVRFRAIVRYPNHVPPEVSPEKRVGPSSHPGRTIARLARHVERAVATVELTLSQYRVLGVLGDGREAASALADKLAVSRPSVTGVVDGLVARGLVRRGQADGDRRRVDIDLTDAGRVLLAAADAAVDERLDRILELVRELPR
jgi:DNA-binding MarR family transcriptional regulator